jgi:hypothetical protein
MQCNDFSCNLIIRISTVEENEKTVLQSHNHYVYLHVYILLFACERINL